MNSQVTVEQIESAIAEQVSSFCMDDDNDRRRMAMWIHDLLVTRSLPRWSRGPVHVSFKSASRVLAATDRNESLRGTGDRKTIPVPPMSNAELMKSRRNGKRGGK